MSLQRDVKQILNSTGLSYEIRAGSKHYQIFLAGKRIAVISMSRSTNGCAPYASVKRGIKWRLRELGLNYKDNTYLRGA